MTLKELNTEIKTNSQLTSIQKDIYIGSLKGKKIELIGDIRDIDSSYVHLFDNFNLDSDDFYLNNFSFVNDLDKSLKINFHSLKNQILQEKNLDFGFSFKINHSDNYKVVSSLKAYDRVRMQCEINNGHFRPLNLEFRLLSVDLIHNREVTLKIREIEKINFIKRLEEANKKLEEAEKRKNDQHLEKVMKEINEKRKSEEEIINQKIANIKKRRLSECRNGFIIGLIISLFISLLAHKPLPILIFILSSIGAYIGYNRDWFRWNQ